MKKNKIYLIFVFSVICTLFTSCSGDSGNEMVDGASNETSYDLIVSPTNASKTNERNLIINSTPNTSVKVNVKFISDKKMYRLYITKNNLGTSEGSVPFSFSQKVDLKSDGSIDLERKDKKEFIYNIDFDAPSADETVQYVLWVTTDRGDFRDISKRNAIAPDAFGTITIKGSENADIEVNGVKSFTQILLSAPLADGSSKTFLSLFDKKVYAIDKGVEYSAFWDFGYYYGKTNKASLASVSSYPKSIVDVEKIAKTNELNNFYFKKSAKTVSEFNAISKKSDLDFITKPSQQFVQNLNVDDVIEFVDAYGNKGLIKVVKIVEGYGKNGSIKFDVKVQINAEPIKD